MKIAVFFHIYAINHWREITAEQMQIMKNSGLLDAAELYVGVIGVKDDVRYLVERYPVKEVYLTDRNTAEYFTLKHLHRFCKEHPDYQIFYGHTKGVTQPGHYETFHNAWRGVMSDLLFDKWDIVSPLLKAFDVVGSLYAAYGGWNEQTNEWQGKPGDAKLICGNFFAAKASWLAQLPTPDDTQERWLLEYWSTLGTPNVFDYGRSVLLKRKNVPTVYSLASMIADLTNWKTHNRAEYDAVARSVRLIA